MFIAAFIIFGGFRRLSAFSEKLIPLMSVLYIAGCVVIIIMNIKVIPDVFGSIFKFALGPDAVLGGAVGTSVKLAFNTVKQGCKRGVFSNEAGLGSSVMAHSNSCVREPVKQGMWGIAEVFLDTIVICTMTAMVVLSSGAIDLSTGLPVPGTNDATLVTKAFGRCLGQPGEWFVVVLIGIFAFTTVLGWSFYGGKVTEYLFGITVSKIYRFVYVAFIILGAITESNITWDISDTFNGLMMIPNLIGVLALTPLVIKITKNYKDRKLKGMDITPVLSFDPNIAKDAEKAVKKGMD